MVDTIKALSLFSIIDGTAYPTFGSRPLPIIGYDKLYTEVIKYFITEEGSDILDKEFGTSLLTLINKGGDELFIEEVIDSSMAKTRQFFATKEENALLEGSPLDPSEALLVFELISFETEVDILNVYVRIANKLGENKVVRIIV